MANKGNRTYPYAMFNPQKHPVQVTETEPLYKYDADNKKYTDEVTGIGLETMVAGMPYFNCTIKIYDPAFEVEIGDFLDVDGGKVEFSANNNNLSVIGKFKKIRVIKQNDDMAEPYSNGIDDSDEEIEI